MSFFNEISEMVRNTSTRMSINDHYETPVQEVTSSINKVYEDSKQIVKDDKKPSKDATWISSTSFSSFKKPCWNCKAFGHYPRDCISLFCRCCGMIFETLSDKAYHKTPECPKRDKSSIKSNKRSRIDSPISKEVDAVYAELCDDNMVPKLPDVDPWDEWYSSNAIKRK